MTPRFSTRSLLIGTAVVAVVLAAMTYLTRLWQTQRRVTGLVQQVQQLEKALAKQKGQQEQAFLGIHASPLLLIDPRIEKATPWLFRVTNSKYRGHGGDYRVGTQDTPRRQLLFELRLLRSLDDTDYYRFTYSVDGGPDRVVLFAYRGKAQLILQQESLGVSIAPDSDSAIRTVLPMYREENRRKIGEAWSERLILREMNAAVRRRPATSR